MENARDVEVLRRPGSPQLEAQRVRGSWRDYLEPIDPADIIECADDSSPNELGEFEPFSDTCGEFEDESEEELNGLDLALFEPGSCTHAQTACCCSCPYHYGVCVAAGYLRMLIVHPSKGKNHGNCAETLA